jgi:hypothetical protein
MLDSLEDARNAFKGLRALERLVRGSPADRAKVKVLDELTLSVGAQPAPDDLAAQEAVAAAVREHIALPSEP